MGIPSSSTGCALIAGTDVLIEGVCVATAGEMGVSLGGGLDVGSAIVAVADRTLCVGITGG